MYFMKLSDKRFGLHPSSRTPKKVKKNAIEAVYVGYLPASDRLCKCYEIWQGGSPRVRNRSDRCWSTPVNRFRCVATPKLGPFHWQGPSGLLHCGSRYRGNAWFHKWMTPSSMLEHPLCRNSDPISLSPDGATSRVSRVNCPTRTNQVNPRGSQGHLHHVSLGANAPWKILGGKFF